MKSSDMYIPGGNYQWTEEEWIDDSGDNRDRERGINLHAYEMEQEGF